MQWRPLIVILQSQSLHDQPRCTDCSPEAPETGASPLQGWDLQPTPSAEMATMRNAWQPSSLVEDA